MVRLSTKRVANGLLWGSTVALICFGSAAPAFASLFGLGAIVQIQDHLFNGPSTYYQSVDPDPGGGFNGGPNALLVPESVFYTNGASVASASLSRSVSLSIGNSSAFGSASADRVTGTLRSYARASGGTPFEGLSTYVAAGLSETITPVVDGTFIFDLYVDGTTTGLANSGVWLALDNTIYMGQRGETNPLYMADGSSNPEYCLPLCHFAFNVAVTAGVPYILRVAVDSGAADGVTDLSRTVRIGVSGVEFTSASGIFLTGLNPPDPTQPVPEPSTLLLLGASLAGMGGLKWRMCTLLRDRGGNEICRIATTRSAA